MKDFFKNRTWDDYLAMVVVVLIVLGAALFFIGFYWGFTPKAMVPGFEDTTFDLLGNASVHKVLSNTTYQSIYGLGDYNLFSLAGKIDSSFGTLYAMVVVSLLGFSFMMLGIAIMISVIVIGLVWEAILRKKNK